MPPALRGNGRTYTRGYDTMDVWFDSGVAWRAVLQPRGIVVGAPSAGADTGTGAGTSTSTGTGTPAGTSTSADASTGAANADSSALHIPAVDAVLEGEDQFRGWCVWFARVF